MLSLLWGYSQIPIVLYEIVEYPLPVNKYSDISKKVDETSGLIYLNGQLWSFNDSFGKPELYALEKESGKVTQTIVIDSATNVDWESIAMDKDFIYVGDFGNNFGNRKNLKIYKLRISDIGEEKKGRLTAETISFSYNDQDSFEQLNRKNNHDCEAMISFENSLMIFSKNWGNGKTKMYIIPKEPGNYKIDPVSYFDIDGLVTGADFNPETSQLALIGYKKYVPFIFLFEDFKGETLSVEKVYRINLGGMKDTQTEGITWLDKTQIIFSAEKTSAYDQSAYILDVAKVFKLASITE
jgi:hypothetical protein